jgi:hypothetical protein
LFFVLFQLLITGYSLPSKLIVSTLMMEEIRTQRHIPGDGILQSRAKGQGFALFCWKVNMLHRLGPSPNNKHMNHLTFSRRNIPEDAILQHEHDIESKLYFRILFPYPVAQSV